MLDCARERAGDLHRPIRTSSNSLGREAVVATVAGSQDARRAKRLPDDLDAVVWN